MPTAGNEREPIRGGLALFLIEKERVPMEYLEGKWLLPRGFILGVHFEECDCGCERTRLEMYFGLFALAITFASKKGDKPS